MISSFSDRESVIRDTKDERSGKRKINKFGFKFDFNTSEVAFYKTRFVHILKAL